MTNLSLEDVFGEDSDDQKSMTDDEDKTSLEKMNALPLVEPSQIKEKKDMDKTTLSVHKKVEKMASLPSFESKKVEDYLKILESIYLTFIKIGKNILSILR